MLEFVTSQIRTRFPNGPECACRGGTSAELHQDLQGSGIGQDLSRVKPWEPWQANETKSCQPKRLVRVQSSGAGQDNRDC